MTSELREDVPVPKVGWRSRRRISVFLLLLVVDMDKVMASARAVARPMTPPPMMQAWTWCVDVDAGMVISCVDDGWMNDRVTD